MAQIQNVYIICIEDVFIHTSNNLSLTDWSKTVDLLFSQINPYEKYIKSVLKNYNRKTILQPLRCSRIRYCYFINKIFFITLLNSIYFSNNKLFFVYKDFLLKEDVLAFLQYYAVNPNLNFDFIRYDQKSIISVTENHKGLRLNKYASIIDNELKSIIELRKRGFNAFNANQSNTSSIDGKKYIEFLSKYTYFSDSLLPAY